MAELKGVQCHLTFDLNFVDITEELDTTVVAVIELWNKGGLIRVLEEEVGTLYILELSQDLDKYGGVKDGSAFG